ncbi:uncharacterized protein LOC116423636 [Sarcophilus harrisii]|uniref:uncharacterized protein LOC116423636 n=1 Tax=Sarcophilus harrisii TaxID=9305 RepID=UPI001301C429|nr:uncharacterized protein LOC116423636 [Sarcophilus harrisii]
MRITHIGPLQWLLSTPARRSTVMRKSCMEWRTNPGASTKRRGRTPHGLCIWIDSKNTSERIFQKQLNLIGQLNLARQKKGKGGKFIWQKESKHLWKHYPKLRKMGAVQEHQIVEEKKEWELMMTIQSRFLTAIITELQEKMQKPEGQWLRHVAETLQSSVVWPNVEPLLVNLDDSYLKFGMAFVNSSKDISYAKQEMGNSPKIHAQWEAELKWKLNFACEKN